MNERMNVNQKSTQPDRVGFFGKVPAHGDFIASGFERATEAAIDAFLRNGLQALGAQEQPGWKQQFLDGATWRFVAERGVFGSAVLAGILMPSSDRVDRCFPLVIATQMPAFDQHPSALCYDEDWFDQLTELGRGAMTKHFSIAPFSQAIRSMRSPLAAQTTGPFKSGDGMATTLWWRYDETTRSTVGFRTQGNPTAKDFVRLFATETIATALPDRVEAEPAPEPLVEATVAQTGIRYGYAMHPGTRTTINSNSLVVSEDPILFAIAAGHGSEQVFAEYAKMATSTVAQVEKRDTINQQIHEIYAKLNLAHNLLRGRTQKASEPLASIVLFTLVDGTSAIVWAGDARAYLMRDGMMRLLTFDHVEVGMRSRLTKGLGGMNVFSCDSSVDQPQQNDRLLLCSASLVRVLGERRIAQVLSGDVVEDIAEALVQDALIASVRENVSAIVVGFDTA